VSVSVLSTNQWEWLSLITKALIGTILVSTFIYVCVKKLVKEFRKRSHANL